MLKILAKDPKTDAKKNDKGGEKRDNINAKKDNPHELGPSSASAPSDADGDIIQNSNQVKMNNYFLLSLLVFVHLGPWSNRCWAGFDILARELSHINKNATPPPLGRDA